MEVQERLRCRRLERDAIEAVGDELKVRRGVERVVQDLGFEICG
jgi:hypothetical protein